MLQLRRPRSAHSRASGNPGPCCKANKVWVPAFARSSRGGNPSASREEGPTLQTGFQIMFRPLTEIGRETSFRDVQDHHQTSPAFAFRIVVRCVVRDMTMHQPFA